MGGCYLVSRRLLHRLTEWARPSSFAGLLFDCGQRLFRGGVQRRLRGALASGGCRCAPPEVVRDFLGTAGAAAGDDRGIGFACSGWRQPPVRVLKAELSPWLQRARWRAAGGRVRLAVNYYRAASPQRRAELHESLQANAANPAVDELIVLLNDDELPPLPRAVEVVRFDDRPRFADYIRLLDERTRPQDCNVLVNSDCYTDATLADAAARMTANDFLVLTRHERGQHSWQLWEVPYSQDAWGYVGRSRFQAGDLAFPPGSIGCDNVIAWVASQAGYRISNPARDIRLYHLHAEQARSILPRLPAPYVWVNPHGLDEPSQPYVIQNYQGDEGQAVFRP
jgi:hypothetical protein